MVSFIDASAEALRAEAPAVTRRNLFFATRRARGAETTEASFDPALRRRLSHGPLPGLLPERAGRGSRGLPGGLPGGSDTEPPRAVLLVDRPAILGLFLALRGERAPGVAVVCIDGTPAPVVERLAQGFREGLRLPVLYLHDAATIVYPFALEPLATLVRSQGSEAIVYRDLGLPPLGAPARRFGDPSLPADALLVDLEEIPPAALVRYAARAVSA